VFAANAALRAAITPAGRGSKARRCTPEMATPKHVALNWAHRLKRVLGIEIEQCARCGGRLEVIASIEEPELIERIPRRCAREVRTRRRRRRWAHGDRRRRRCFESKTMPHWSKAGAFIQPRATPPSVPT
jgi:hypothetical protein